MAETDLLIVGLGNPGQKYDRTRHNVGFMVVDYLAQEWKVNLSTHKKFQGEFGEAGKIRLLKPTTYMNLSGEAVGAVVRWYKLLPQVVVVIYDDLDLPLGRIRMRKSGSAGGHNGMKSIISHLSTQDFPRLRIGIDRDDRLETSDYVLGKFTSSELSVMPQVFRFVAESLAMLRLEGIDKAMSIYNAQGVSP